MYINTQINLIVIIKHSRDAFLSKKKRRKKILAEKLI